MFGWDCGAVNLAWPYYVLLGVFCFLLVSSCLCGVFYLVYACVVCIAQRRKKAWDKKTKTFVELKDLL